jgi:hypothetical protein
MDLSEVFRRYDLLHRTLGPADIIAKSNASLASAGISGIMRELQKQSALLGLPRSLASAFEGTRGSALMSPIAELSKSLTADFARVQGVAKGLRGLGDVHPGWLRELGALKDVGSPFGSLRELSAFHSATIGDLAKASSALMNRIPVESAAGVWGLSLPDRQGIVSILRESCASVSAIAESFRGLRLDALSVPPLVYKYPSYSLFETIDISDGFLDPARPPELTTEVAAARELVDASAQSLEAAAESAAPDLLTLVHEMRSSYSSGEIGGARHFCLAARELITHCLQRLAPDADVANWTQDEKYYHENRPTRRARLEYILRSLAVEEFANFIDSDIRSTLELMDLLNRYTHHVAPEVGSAQLALMKTKVDSIVLSLIVAATQSKS